MQKRAGSCWPQSICSLTAPRLDTQCKPHLQARVRRTALRWQRNGGDESGHFGRYELQVKAPTSCRSERRRIAVEHHLSLLSHMRVAFVHTYVAFAHSCVRVVQKDRLLSRRRWDDKVQERSELQVPRVPHREVAQTHTNSHGGESWRVLQAALRFSRRRTGRWGMRADSLSNRRASSRDCWNCELGECCAIERTGTRWMSTRSATSPLRTRSEPRPL